MIQYSKYIDHSPLKMDITEEEVLLHCKEAIDYNFYSIVVFPSFIETAKKAIEFSDIKLVTVAGFPFGNDCNKS